MQLEDYLEFEQFDNSDRIRVKGTRVAIEVLLEEFIKGARPDEIQRNYPTVTGEQVYATINYYLHNQAEMDAYRQRSRDAADGAYQEWLRTHKPSPLEQRIRAVREISARGKAAAP
jgi:uncharacterized protein (DUF433 family)